jgi:hypothetical protein
VAKGEQLAGLIVYQKRTKIVCARYRSSLALGQVSIADVRHQVERIELLTSRAPTVSLPASVPGPSEVPNGSRARFAERTLLDPARPLYLIVVSVGELRGWGGKIIGLPIPIVV